MGARVLDLFAGSGALGIEALSRGAAEAVFVDSSRLACSAVKRNLAACGFTGRVLHGEALYVLERLARRKEVFDLVLADPPYASSLAGRLLRSPALPLVVREGGRVVVECAEEPEVPGWARPVKVRRYGDTVIVVLERLGEGEG